MMINLVEHSKLCSNLLRVLHPHISHTHTHTHSCHCTFHLSSSNQPAECDVSAGAAGQSQSVGEQAEAVVTGDAESQTGLQEHQGCRHLAPRLSLTDGVQGGISAQ